MSEFCAHLPLFWKAHNLQHPAQIGDAGRAAGAALQANDALDRRDVIETLAAEIVLEIDRLFRKRI